MLVSEADALLRRLGMGGSRTVRTLTALLVAMTLGVMVLMILETEPVRPTAQPLAVLNPPPDGPGQVVYETRAAIQTYKWRHVIVHSAPAATAPPAAECHFLVLAGPDGRGHVASTARWLDQQEGRHIDDLWQESSIGVCLIGDFSHYPPGRGQFDSLVDLVHSLQELCDIPADRVYLHSDLVARSASPGRAFPNAAFAARLLGPQR